jgi:hypothetical protein
MPAQFDENSPPPRQRTGTNPRPRAAYNVPSIVPKSAGPVTVPSDPTPGKPPASLVKALAALRAAPAGSGLRPDRSPQAGPTQTDQILQRLGIVLPDHALHSRPQFTTPPPAATPAPQADDDDDEGTLDLDRLAPARALTLQKYVVAAVSAGCGYHVFLRLVGV